jgi:hypothetical protein
MSGGTVFNNMVIAVDITVRVSAGWNAFDTATGEPDRMLVLSGCGKSAFSPREKEALPRDQ